tara:strand:+ start:82 stop:531 length:450 start_codon:yes stop_codon:yes gene_type:complete
MEELRERARIREEAEAAQAKHAELERRRQIATDRLNKANNPPGVAHTTARAAARRTASAGPRSRGKTRGKANELAHDVWVGEEAKQARAYYGKLQQLVKHLEAETRKAAEKMSALRALEREMDKAEAAATHHVPRAPSMAAVIASAFGP